MGTLLVEGGRVLRPDASVVRADVLVDRSAGVVLDVARGLTGDRVLDAEDCLVMPGLVNGHCHAGMTLLRGYADDKVLGDWLETDVWPVEAEMRPEDVRAGAELAALEMIRSGTTAFVDMYFSPEQTVEAIDAAGIRGMVGRGAITVQGGDPDREVELAVETATRFDGAADGRVSTAVMAHALTTVSDDALDRLAAEARALDLPLHYHANERVDHQVAPVVEAHGERPLAFARRRGLLAQGDFVAHGVHLDATEIDLLAGANAGVVHCPASNLKLVSGLAPVRDLLDAGVPVGLGTDGACSNNDLDMFGEMRDALAVSRLREGSRPLSPKRIVRMATAGSAAVTGLPGGRIEAGAPADLAVVDLSGPHLRPSAEPCRQLVRAGRGADVRHTVCDGRVVMRNRRVTTLDAEAVVERANERASALVARVD